MQTTRDNYFTNIYLDHFTEIYSRSDKKLIDRISTSIDRHIDKISQTYFEVLRSTDEGKQLSSNKENIATY